MDKLPRLGLPIIIVLIITIVVLAKSAVTIDAGEAGVLFKTFGEGVVPKKPPLVKVSFIAPWNKVIVYEVRQQEFFEEMKVLSSNGLEIQIDATAWYKPVTAD